LAAIGPACAASASAASWETVQNFAPLKQVEPNPAQWPEEVQLGGASGMAVNVSGAGGVEPGTIYTIGSSTEAAWHAARYSPDGDFELAWTSFYHCGPKATPPSTCPTYPTGTSGGVDIALDQTTGSVYVFSKFGNPTVSEYNPDGTGPITRFLETDTPGTIVTSPEKLHGSPLNENIAVDTFGNVYVVDEETTFGSNFGHRVMVFKPQTPGDYEHYVYAGLSHDIAPSALGTRPPFRPVVDDAGNLYVAGEGYIEEYNPAQPSTAICAVSLPNGGLTSMTVNPETGAPFYYSAKERRIHQFSPCNSAGRFVEDAGPSFSAVPQRGNLEAMAFDPTRAFHPAGAPEVPPSSGKFEEEHPAGVLYAAAGEACPGSGECPLEARGRGALGYMFAPQITREPVVVSESVTQVGVANATLNAQVNPKGSQTSFVFQYLTNSAYAQNTHSQRFVISASGGNFTLGFEDQSSAPLPFDASAEEVAAALEGLSSVGSGNVSVEGGPGDPSGTSPYQITFGSTLGGGPLPSITTDGSKLTGTNASVRVLDTSFNGAGQSPFGGAVLGTGQQPLLASATISGLLPATAYRYRVVATSVEGSASGAAELFQTYGAEAEGLADGRVYEMVSPFQKNGGEVLPAEPDSASCGSECKPGLAAKRFPVQVLPDGNGIAYQGQPFLLNEGATEFDEYVSTRTGAGWQTTSLSPPLAGDNGGGGFQEFGFNTDLAASLVFVQNPALTREAPAEYQNLFEQPTENRLAVRPILTATPPNRPPADPGGFKFEYVGATADHSRVFLQANDALTDATPYAPAAVDGGATKFNLYEWNGGQLRLVNVQPGNGVTIPGAALGSGLLRSTTQPPAADLSHAISSDGTHVFWTQEGTGPEAGSLFARITRGESAETVKLPGPGNCKASVPQVQRVCFLTASADGSKVLLSNGQVDEMNEATGAYEVGVDLTSGTGGFQGVLGQSEDLSHIYFVVGPSTGTGNLTSGSATVTNVQTTSGAFAAGQNIVGAGIPAGAAIVAVGAGTLQLSAPATATGENVPLSAQGLPTDGEENGEGAKAEPDGYNLYSWHGGVTSFVGTLVATDGGEELGLWSAYPGARRAEASPDGRWLAFNSKATLTGFDNVGGCAFNPVTLKWAGLVPCEEVFLYDSQSGSLKCVSCNPTGSRPLGGSFLRRMYLAPGYLPQPRYLTDEGRLFFDSRDSLSTLDTNNGVEDVYEYEPAGIGSCGRSEGCVSLISGGRGSYDSNFLAMGGGGAEEGNDVFFTTRNRLVPRDTDSLIDVYDARASGGLSEDYAQPSPECSGEGCQGPTAPVPGEPTPGSSTVESSGNVKPKPAHKKKKHHHKKKSKHKAKKHKSKRAKHGRGGSK
jgi:hypothetical protein